MTGIQPISFHHKDSRRQHYWLYKCFCGEEFITRKYSIGNKHTMSCGCLQQKSRQINMSLRRTHGLCNSPTWRSYTHAKNRCTNPRDIGWKLYGGRGILFCYGSIEELVYDIGLRPVGTTLDRINNNGNYEPGNCRWATAKQQARNRRKCHI